tara:strand:- start:1207 stop:1323 length:117 start_codon:yes stop_codon:yes gene_type:complete
MLFNFLAGVPETVTHDKTGEKLASFAHQEAEKFNFRFF